MGLRRSLLEECGDEMGPLALGEAVFQRGIRELRADKQVAIANELLERHFVKDMETGLIYGLRRDGTRYPPESFGHVSEGYELLGR